MEVKLCECLQKLHHKSTRRRSSAAPGVFITINLAAAPQADQTAPPANFDVLGVDSSAPCKQPVHLEASSCNTKKQQRNTVIFNNDS